MPGDSNRQALVVPPDFTLKRKADTGEGMTRSDMTRAAVEVMTHHAALAHAELIEAIERLLEQAERAHVRGTLPDAETMNLRNGCGDAARLAEAFGYEQLREVLESVAGLGADAPAGKFRVDFVGVWASTLRLHLPRLREDRRDTLAPESHRPLLAGLAAAAERLRRPT